MVTTPTAAPTTTLTTTVNVNMGTLEMGTLVQVNLTFNVTGHGCSCELVEYRSEVHLCYAIRLVEIRLTRTVYKQQDS